MKLRRKIFTTLGKGMLVSLGLVGSGLPGQAGADPLPVHVATPNAVTAHAFDCGDIIELTPGSTVKLAGDVGPCPVGLVLGGLVVTGQAGTLDLNGHVIYGTDTTASCEASAPNNDTLDETGDGAGIYVQSAVGITITNSGPDDLDGVFDEGGTEGGITGFDAGIAIDEGSANTVTKVSVHSNKGPGELPTEFGEGIVVRASTGNTIGGSSSSARNVVTCNGPYGGITLYAAAANDIRHNWVKDNKVPEDGHVFQQDDGIRLENGANGNTIRNNTVSGSGLDGIAILNPGTGNTVQNNNVSGSGRYGIAVFDTGPNIIGNTPLVGAGQGNTVGTSGTFDMFDRTTTPPCGLNQWSGNTFTTRNQTCIS